MHDQIEMPDVAGDVIAMAREIEAKDKALKDAINGIDPFWAKCRPQVMRRIHAVVKTPPHESLVPREAATEEKR